MSTPGEEPPVPIALTANEWQRLSINLHAARTLIARFAAGEASADDPKFAVGAGVLMETLEEWEQLIEELRPKTALADRRRLPNEEKIERWRSDGYVIVKRDDLEALMDADDWAGVIEATKRLRSRLADE